MKNAFLVSTIWLAMASIGIAQTLEITFSATGESSIVDSVMAINRVKKDTVTLPGNEILYLVTTSAVEKIIESENDLMLYPNPLDRIGTFSFNQTYSGLVHISVRNIIGQEVLSQSQELNKGLHFFCISLNMAGIYIITVSDKLNARSLKFICTDIKHTKSYIKPLSKAEKVSNSSSDLKTGTDGVYRLGYTEGDVLGLVGYSGEMVSIIPAMPLKSRNYEFEFVECKDSDDRNYEIVRMGNQLWMAENLAYLPSVSGPEVGSVTEKYYYVYDYNGTDITEAKGTGEFDSFGVLYNYEAAMSACPDGWSLPSDEDWNDLEWYIGKTVEVIYDLRGFSYLGNILKSSTGWDHWRYSNQNGKNYAGFKAYAAGDRDYRGDFSISGSNSNLNAPFWTSTSVDQERARIRTIHVFGDIGRPAPPKSEGLYVRCNKDASRKIPDLTSKKVSLIAGTTAQSGGAIINDNGSEILQKGVCWRKYEGPMIWDFKTIDGSGYGSFESLLNNLEPRTTYSVRSYAINERGTAYGEIYTFETADGAITDDRDNRHYEYVHIRDQTWMKGNLAYLPDDGNSWFYENDSMKLEEYGRLYDWNTATSDNHGNGKDICPTGWHLPTDEEWKTLEISYGMSLTEVDTSGYRSSGKVGEQLKAEYGWNKNGNGNNRAGFYALPGGMSYNQGEFDAIGDHAVFWTATPSDSIKSWARSLLFNYDGIGRIANDNSFGFSVRCLRDPL